MKNKGLNGLVGVILGAIFSTTELYVSIGLTIYGLWLASKVFKEKDEQDKTIAVITYVIGLPLIIFLFYSFFKQLI